MKLWYPLTLLLISSLGFPDYGPQQPAWYAVNDSVMGGVSTGGASEMEQGVVRFSGVLSLENRGGFSSIRSNSPDFAVAPGNDLVIKVKGDGRSYYFDLRTNPKQRAFTYRKSFQTKEGELMEIRLPLSEFEASSFGRRLPMFTPLDPEKIQSIGVTLSDKMPGPFQLEILEIRTEPAEISLLRDPAQLIEFAIERGVPLYNRGDVDACAAVYETALLGLTLLPEKELTPEGRRMLMDTLSTASKSATTDEKAWALRRGMDRLLAEMNKD